MLFFLSVQHLFWHTTNPVRDSLCQKCAQHCCARASWIWHHHCRQVRLAQHVSFVRNSSHNSFYSQGFGQFTQLTLTAPIGKYELWVSCLGVNSTFSDDITISNQAASLTFPFPLLTSIYVGDPVPADGLCVQAFTASGAVLPGTAVFVLVADSFSNGLQPTGPQFESTFLEIITNERGIA